MQDRLAALTAINLNDLVGAFGWQNRRGWSGAARSLFRIPARNFARQMVEFDDLAGASGLVEAARRTEGLLVRGVRVYGAEHLPKGAFLALSNHPGLTDTLALFAALGREDLRIIALDRPFLLSLENISRHLFYLPVETSARVSLVRRVAEHLRAGGSVLTFPAGRNEPDPDAYPGAADALAQWIESAAVFVRLAPGTPIVPVCVRGVTWLAAARNPLVLRRRTADERQLLASALQLLWQSLFRVKPVTVRIQFGRPITAAEGKSGDPIALHAGVLEEMRRMIENPPEGSGRSVL